MGDFNEQEPVGSPEQSLAVLFQAKPPMYDVFESLKARISTHASGKALDRVLLSEAMVKGLNGLKFESVSVQRHGHGKGAERGLRPTALRTAKCSSAALVYWRGISQPPICPSVPPSFWCIAESGV